MASTSDGHADTSADEASPNGWRLRRLFSLPNGDPAAFFLHNFENADLAKRVTEHGGWITDDDDDADVILVSSRHEYNFLKDKYAISRKSHVRMSGFVDRCINARRFQLEPTLEKKKLPGRRPGSRRTEFTKADDENLCQYIAQVLPYKEEGGRTGHLIYEDLLRRVEKFGQYKWARRHPKDGWRERYRKNRDRLDRRIAQIVAGNPPPPDGKGRYVSRRYERMSRVVEMSDDNDEFGAESGQSATDNEGGPVKPKRINAQPQEEEEEEEEDGGEIPMPRPGAEEPAPFEDLDATLRGAEVGDKLAEEPEPPPIEEAEADDFVPAPEQSSPPAAAAAAAPEVTEPETGKRKRGRPRVQPMVSPLSPRLTRARSRVQPPEASPARPPGLKPKPKIKPRARAKGKAKASAPEPIPESQVVDEFVANSDDDENEMHEVEADLQVDVESRGGLPADDQTRGLSADDLPQTTGDLQHAQPDVATLPNPDDSDDDSDDDDDNDDELLAYVRKLDVHARVAAPVPPATATAGQNKGGDNRDRHSSEGEEIFPSPGTRAGAEKRRRTQAAKAAPYVPPRGTRAAAFMVEKERATAVRRR